jgi:type IV pilus assembly protein PilB
MNTHLDSGTATAVLTPTPSGSLLPQPLSFRTKTPMRLGEQLILAGLITEDELDAALSEQSAKQTRLGEALLELGFVDEEQLLPYLAAQLGIPAVRLREGLIDPSVVRLIPRPVARDMRVLALFKIRNTLTVAMAEPQNLEQIDEIERLTGLEVRPVCALRAAIEKVVPRAYENDFGVDTVTADFDTESITVENEAIEIDLQEVGSMADGSPVINLVNYMIVHAVRQKASDIHIEPGIKHSSVRFRVDGQLREVLKPRREFHPALV